MLNINNQETGSSIHSRMLHIITFCELGQLVIHVYNKYFKQYLKTKCIAC